MFDPSKVCFGALLCFLSLSLPVLARIQEPADVIIDIDCSREYWDSYEFCADPLHNADTGYAIIAGKLKPCEGDCDFDWLGNDDYHRIRAQNEIYALSRNRYLLIHEDAPLGAYGGGDKTLFLIKRTGETLKIRSLKDDKGRITGGERGWWYNEENRTVSLQRVTNSVGVCSLEYIYKFSGDVIRLEKLGLHKETMQMEECKYVMEEIQKYPFSMIKIKKDF